MTRDDDPDESEQNVYGDQAREHLMEDGEISPEEDAFMAGYDSSDSEEEDTTNPAYEAAFTGRRVKKRRSRQEDPFEEEDPIEP